MFGNILSALGIGIASGAASVESNPVTTDQVKKRGIFGEILASLGLGVASAAKGGSDVTEISVKDSDAGKSNAGFYILLFAIIAIFAGTAYFITIKKK